MFATSYGNTFKVKVSIKHYLFHFLMFVKENGCIFRSKYEQTLKNRCINVENIISN